MIPCTFQTGCYEADWRVILSGDYLKKKIDACGYSFVAKNLFINNVSDRKSVIEACERLKKEGVVSAYYFSEDYIDEALHFFNLTRDDLGSQQQSYYSLFEFVGMYLCKTPYLLSFKDDACIYKGIQRRNISISWVEELISELEQNENYVTGNPRWGSSRSAKKEAINQITASGNYYLSHTFSDQCFLCKTYIFKNDIYRYEHADSDRFPSYGGNGFERRCNSFLNVKQLYRLTAKNIRYYHCDFPKSVRKMKILAFISKYFGYMPTNIMIQLFRYLSVKKLLKKIFHFFNF